MSGIKYESPTHPRLAKRNEAILIGLLFMFFYCSIWYSSVRFARV